MWLGPEKITVPAAAIVAISVHAAGGWRWEHPTAIGLTVVLVGAIVRAIRRAGYRDKFMKLTEEEAGVIRLLRESDKK